VYSLRRITASDYPFVIFKPFSLCEIVSKSQTLVGVFFFSVFMSVYLLIFLAAEP